MNQIYKTAQGQYSYFSDSSGHHAINNATGEITDSIIVELPVGSSVITPEDRERINQRKEKERERELQKKANDNYGRRFFFASKGQDFNSLSPATLGRLVFLASYMQYDKTLRFASNGKCITREDLPSLLNVSKSTAKRFWDEVSPLFLRESEDRTLLIENEVFIRGSLSKRRGESFQKVYINGIRKLYRSVPTSKHKHLGYVFGLVPYINNQYNILCFDVDETEFDNIEELTISDFCTLIGYNKTDISRLFRVYKDIAFDVNGHKERFISVVYDGLERNRARIYVNPHIIYSGSIYEQVEILGKFCKD